jgi:hypothetical protein
MTIQPELQPGILQANAPVSPDFRETRGQVRMHDRNFHNQKPFKMTVWHRHRPLHPTTQVADPLPPRSPLQNGLRTEPV